jgi:mRNA interferase HigB
VRVISKPAILKFAERHPDALAPLMNWFRITRRADWSSMAEVRTDVAHADIVGRRTVFNVHGNDYRFIAPVNYRTKRVFILYILTHVEYSKGTGKNEYDD